MNEPKRIKAFQFSLAKEIPKFPNNCASLKALHGKSLGELLIHYINWKVRYVEPRQRTVVIEPNATADPRWRSLSGEIDALLLNKVRQSDDLTPYLSLKPHTRGFTPAASAASRWADKDMILNVMGYHHFHFDAAPHDHMRSDDVLFARVTRDNFTVKGIFDHEVFDDPSAGAAMTAERERLWNGFLERATRNAPPGTTVVPAVISLAGHPFSFFAYARRCAKRISETDPKLDDPNFVQGLYEQAGIDMPKKPKLIWHMKGLDLVLFDEKSPAFFGLLKGPI